MKKLIYYSSFLLFLIGYEAQAQFTLSAEVRPRSEFRNGFKTLTNDVKEAAFFTEQRSRLNADFINEDYQLRVSFQDIRIWGESPQIFKREPGNSFISEAWGRYFIKPSFSVKAGRQMISYDNQRILGGLEWAQQGRRHDALLFMYEGAENNSKLHLGFAYNQDNLVPEPVLLQAEGARFYSLLGANYKTMQYGYFSKKIKKSYISLLALNTGYQNADSSISNKQTIGMYGTSVLGGIKLGGDLYYQAGKQGNRDVSALLAGINATFTTSITPLTFGVEYISGDDDPSDSKVTSFSPDFGTNHAHNGFMDYFFVGPANGNVGVTDFYLKTNFKVLGGALNVNIHEFLTGSEQKNAEGETLDKAMGTEVDLVYVKKLKGGVVWHLGYSQMLATDTMEALRGGDKGAIQNWAWSMITFSPTLFVSK